MRSTAPRNRAHRASFNARGRPAHGAHEPCQVRIVKVTSGMATGRTRRRGGATRSEWWAIFKSREEFAACAADDPLRFSEPLLFGHITAQARDVFGQ